MKNRIPFLILIALVLCIAGRFIRKQVHQPTPSIMQVRTAGSLQNTGILTGSTNENSALPPQQANNPIATTVPSEGATFALVPGATTYRLSRNQEVDRTITQGETIWQGTTQFRQGALQRDGDELVAGGIIIDMNTMKLQKTISGTGIDFTNTSFFDVINHPTASFIFQEVGNGKIVGVLSMKGVSNQISFPAVIINKEDQTIITATFSIDGRKRGVLGADPTVSNFIDLTFTLRFVR